MYQTCATSGCSRRTKGFSKHCGSCGKRNARHGHPLQETISKGDLAPYRRSVRNFLNSRTDRDAWTKAADRLAVLTEQATTYIAAYQGGTAVNRWQLQAYRMILRVIEDAATTTVIETVAGMALYRCREPRRFRSDEAFLTQMTRRFVGLTDQNAGTYYSHALGRTVRVYRDTPPRTAVILGRLLMETIGVISLVQHRQEVERQRAERQASQALFDALVEGGEHVAR